MLSLLNLFDLGQKLYFNMFIDPLPSKNDKITAIFFSGLMPNEYSVCTFQDELASIHWTNSFFFFLKILLHCDC